MPTQLLIATGNAGKVKEIRHEFHLAAAHHSFLASIEILGLKDLPHPLPECVEDRPTFIGNATKKSRHYASLSGLLTLADDSGLCVDALGGAPGVLSARYAGITGYGADAANNAKLLQAIGDIPDDQLQARFVCAMAVSQPHADLAVVVDDVPGRLLRAPRGENGFGYDPLFYFPAFGKSTAELDMTTKSQISHRGKALRRMIAWLGSSKLLKSGGT
ncbi:MAG TPA: non-canonical purine NTP pyrophosphatase [Phycisphaerae bacterium]|jgi:XTP/dITP diphosphohydrolase